MKRTDIAMIILIAATSIAIAYFVTKGIMGDATTEPVKVDSIEKIETSIVSPDPKIFNENAINPAVEVQITPTIK